MKKPTAMRPLFVERLWQERECDYCGAVILTNIEDVMSAHPDNHEDDCAYADPRDEDDES